MPAQREGHEGTPQQWLKYAQDDLAIAELVLRQEEPACAIAAFHAQQAAEKALKGFLVHRGVTFPYTHSISALREIAQPHAAWVDGLAGADRLTLYAATTRYPGIALYVGLDDARQAVDLAAAVLVEVCRALEQDGMDLEDVRR